MSIGIELLSHEFGHMFGHLRDEYIISNTADSSTISSHNKNNCVRIGGCEKQLDGRCEPTGNHRWSVIPGFDGEVFSGCGYSSLFRDEFNSIMRDEWAFYEDEWADGWGEVNEYYLRKKLEKY